MILTREEDHQKRTLASKIFYSNTDTKRPKLQLIKALHIKLTELQIEVLVNLSLTLITRKRQHNNR